MLVEHWENAKLKCSKISTFQNREITMQQKYNGLRYLSIQLYQLPVCHSIKFIFSSFKYSLMGELNFRGYLISRFYPTHEIQSSGTYLEQVCWQPA